MYHKLITINQTSHIRNKLHIFKYRIEQVTYFASRCASQTSSRVLLRVE